MRKKEKEILFPCFLECYKFCPDNFWSGIFEDLSYGKAPHGVYISKEFLCCSYKNKEFSYKIETKDPYVLFSEVYDLLTNKFGLLSFEEKVKKRIEFTRMGQKIKSSYEDWNSIRKSKIKDFFIELFIIEMKAKWGLSQKQTQNLLSIITLAMTFKILTTKDIQYARAEERTDDGGGNERRGFETHGNGRREGGKIIGIDGIHFKKKGYTLDEGLICGGDTGFFDDDEEDDDVYVDVYAGVRMKKNVLRDAWLKYLKEIQKVKI